jgi:phage terminase large subunit
MPLYWANLTAKEKIVINPGGTYSGKTQSLIRVCLTLAAMRFWPNGVTICTGTLTKLKEDGISIFEGLLSTNKVLASLVKTYNRSEFKVTFKNGTTVKFTSFENSLQAEGAKCDILYICEAPRLSWDIAYRLIFRTNFKVYIDYNPAQEFWVDSKIINCKVNPRTGRKEFNSVKILRSWHIHNQFIGQEKRDELENITDDEIYKVYARGLKGKLRGIIYNFKEVEKIPEGLPFGFGIDFGYNSDQSAIVKIWYDKRDRYYQELLYKCENDILTEIIENGLNITPAKYMANILKAHGCTAGTLVWGDHDKSYSTALRREGIPFRMARKGPNSVIMGISKVRECNNYYFNSPMLEKELSTYKWATAVDAASGDEVTTNQPVDGFSDHLLSALRYWDFSYAMRFAPLE